MSRARGGAEEPSHVAFRRYPNAVARFFEMGRYGIVIVFVSELAVEGTQTRTCIKNQFPGKPQTYEIASHLVLSIV